MDLTENPVPNESKLLENSLKSTTLESFKNSEVKAVSWNFFIPKDHKQFFPTDLVTFF